MGSTLVVIFLVAVIPMSDSRLALEHNFSSFHYKLVQMAGQTWIIDGEERLQDLTLLETTFRAATENYNPKRPYLYFCWTSNAATQQRSGSSLHLTILSVTDPLAQLASSLDSDIYCLMQNAFLLCQGHMIYITLDNVVAGLGRQQV